MKPLTIAHLPRLGGLFLFGLVLAGCQGSTGGTGSENASPTSAQANPATSESEDADCCKPANAADTVASSGVRKLRIPDVPVADQDGRAVRFYSDLVKGKVVAINFVFTTCKVACPSLGAAFGKLQEKLGNRLGRDVFLISVSVDPMVDRPARLKEWAGRFGARPGWTLVTASEGHKAEIDRLLRAVQAVSSSEKSDHAQSVFVVDGDSLEAWKSPKGASADKLAEMVGQALLTRASRSYFTDSTLVDQDDRRYRFYSDLLKGKVVVLHCFFTSCKTSCVVMCSNLAKLQERLGDRLGRDVVFLSLTVDPDTDTVTELAKYARRCGARPGWHFLTSTKEDLSRVRERLWKDKVENRDAHSWIMLVGKESAGLWMKHPDDPRDAEGFRDVEGLYKKIEEALAHDAKAQAAEQ